MGKFDLGDVVRMDNNNDGVERYIILEISESLPGRVINGKVLDSKGYVSVRVGSTLLQSEDNYYLLRPAPVVEVIGGFLDALNNLESSWESSK